MQTNHKPLTEPEMDWPHTWESEFGNHLATDQACSDLQTK